MKQIRGWIGLALFLIGVLMTFSDKTKPASWVSIGFGVGMMASGFNN